MAKERVGGEIGRIWGVALELGEKQAQSFRDRNGPIWLEIWVGGESGGVYRSGRSMEYNSFSLAQMLVAKRNDLRRKLERGRLVEVHDSVSANGNGLPHFRYVAPDELDPLILETQMRGVLVGLSSSYDDYRARLVLQRALAGETFAKPRKTFSEPFFSNGNGV